VPRWEKRALAVTLVLLALGVGLEWVCASWQDWWKDHPLQAGVVGSLLLVAPLLIILERTLHRRFVTAEAQRIEREQEHWHGPALDALRAYADASERTDVAFYERLVEAVDHTGESGAGRPVRELVARIVEHAPDLLPGLCEWLRDEARRSAPLATSATYMLTLHPPLWAHSEIVSKVQRAVGAMAECCAEISATIGDRASLGDRLASLSDEHVTLVNEFRAALHGGEQAGT
jgi:hypothetical protein